MLHRNDVGVTAAVSAEEVAFSDLHGEGFGHCACSNRPSARPPASHLSARGTDGRWAGDGSRCGDGPGPLAWETLSPWCGNRLT